MATTTQKSKSTPEKKDGNKVAKKAASAQRSQKPEAAKPPAYMQAKMAVSHPQDGAEKEADKVAQQVARAPKATPAAPAIPKQDGAKKAQRASLEPKINAEKGDTLALKPVPAAETIQRRPVPENSAEQQLDKKAAAAGKDETKVQREAADPMAGQTTSAETENRIEARRGAGATLPDAAKRDMESQFGQDFSQVRIHTDSEAADLCAETNARAFTVGNDIFFAPGEFSPESDSGRELLAHELTHVVQQGGDVQRVMRAPATTPAATGGKPKSTAAMQGTGKGKLEGETLIIDGLALPDKPGLKDAFGATVMVEKGKRIPRPDNQRQVWMAGVKAPDASKITAKAAKSPEKPGVPSSIYALKAKGTANGFLVGSVADMTPQLKAPWWDANGELNNFDVDHVKEIQLGGPNTTDNMHMLDASANRSAGSRIDKAITARVRNALPIEPPSSGAAPDILGKELPKKSAATSAAGGATAPATAAAPTAGGATADKTPDPAKVAIDEIFKNYTVKFTGVTYDVPLKGKPTTKWSQGQVEGGDTLDPLEKPAAKDLDLLFDDKHVKIFPRPGGGVMYSKELKPDGKFEGGNWGKRLDVVDGSFDRTSGTGKMKVVANTRGGKKPVPGELALQGNPSTPLIATVAPASILPNFQFAFSHSLLSPIALDTAEMDASADLSAAGKLKVDGIPILAGAQIDVQFIGGEIIFSRTFSSDEIALKGPVQIDECSLTVSIASGSGIGIDGAIDFHIGELATGSLTGEGRMNGFSLGAELLFDKELFTGSGRVNYDSEKGLKASGTLGLKPGALKGIKKANFTLAYDDAKKAIDFAGDADLSVPGFKGAKLAAHADDSGNITLAGEATLSDTIPRIKAGKLNVSAERKGDLWSLGGSGELEPDLSGLDASAKIKLDYKDGLLNGKLTANYKRSIVEGNVDLNARAMIGDGGGEAEPMKVWGGGQVNVTAAPWLKATVGLTLDEKGEVTVAGELGLPSSLEIFPRKELNKSLFSLSTQIPIFPGIVAEVGGNLSAKAGIGPGALDQLKIGITYNPDHEEDTHITGDAHVNVPADAGLRLGARVGIGLGITGASVTGGLELGGTLGIDGAAEASAHIDWKPNQGLQFDAEGYLHAEPKFKFDVSGYVAVTALGFSVYDNTWQLAAYELGSNLRLGVRFPIHYKEGQPFNVSLDDVQFEVPDVDPAAMVRDLGNRIF